MSNSPYIIGAKKVLTFHYTLKNTQGEILDSSEPQDPMSFLTGSGHIIPALEDQIQSLQPGEKKTVKLEAKDAYGPVEPKMMIDVPKKELAHLKLELGGWLQIENGGHNRAVRIVKMDDEKVTLDGNHPLAGQDLEFNIEMVEVRPATQDELDHGHAHGPGGHHHH